MIMCTQGSYWHMAYRLKPEEKGIRRYDHRWLQEHLSGTATNTVDFWQYMYHTMHQCSYEHCCQQHGPGCG
jgi:hypothetical protein